MIKSIIFLICYSYLFTYQISYCQNNTYNRPKPEINDNYSTVLGTIGTKRNEPFFFNDRNIVVPCRKNNAPPIFTLQFQNQDTLNPILKEFNYLDNNKKENIFELAKNTKEKKYFDIIIKIALRDTFKEDRGLRRSCLKYLSIYNTEESKKLLYEFAFGNDQELAETAALSLIQLGEFETGLNIIKKYYKCSVLPYDELHNALMTINNADAISILKELTNNPDPSYSIDAACALSLLGYCDYAFQKLEYLSSLKDILIEKKNNLIKNGWYLTYYVGNVMKYDTYNVKKMVVWCLAYYIGTKAAFEIIKKMKNDPEISDEIIELLNSFNIN